ncbi:MAG: hypothetical protein WAU05_06865, partial [Nitrospira sp.]
AEEFPLLASLVERRVGGQKRLPIGQSNLTENGQGFLAASVMSGTEAVEDWTTPPEAAQDHDEVPQPAEATQKEANPQAESTPGVAVVPGPRGRSRPGHYGLSIRFESHEEDPELGRLIESTVVVNDAHPAYRRAVASRSEGYHIALAVALALARLAVPPAEEHDFVMVFLARWGEALDGPRRRSRKRS